VGVVDLEISISIPLTNLFLVQELFVNMEKKYKNREKIYINREKILSPVWRWGVIFLVSIAEYTICSEKLCF